MSLFESIILEINNHLDTTSRNIEPLIPPLAEAINLFTEALLAGRKVLCCTSAGDAQAGRQFCYSLMHGNGLERPGLPAIFLEASAIPILSTIGNETNSIFAHQIEALANKNDVLLLIGDQGQQQSLELAIAASREKEMHLVAIFAQEQIELTSRITDQDVLIVTQAGTVQQSILLHYLISAIIASQIEQQLFGSAFS